MVHQRGFEPLTARFVAEYSIQLSYWCILIPDSDAASASDLISLTERYLIIWCTREDSNL